MSLRTTPFHGRHVALGGRLVPFAGFELPVQYPAGLRAEHLAVRRAAGLFDVSHMGEIRFTGPEAEAALSWLLSGDVAGMAVGEARYHMLCNPEGGVVDDVYAYRLAPDDFLVCVNAANRDKDLAWILANTRVDAVEIADEGDRWAQLAVQGPKAVEVVAALTGVDVGGQAARTFQRATVAGVAGCLVARTGYTGEDGFEIFAPADAAGPLWDAILDAGTPHGLLPCGLGARDTLRLEARNCLYGHELTEETTPWQAGLGWTVHLDHPFVGREALVAKKGTAPRRLAGLVVEGRRIPRQGCPVRVDGTEVGVVTSGTRSPCLETGIALAYLDRGIGRPGASVVIDVRGRPAEARVHRGPFTRLFAR